MLPQGRWRFWVIALFVLGGIACGQANPSGDEPDPPPRPDLTELTPEQATSAMAKYRKAIDEWERIVAPRQEVAIQAAIVAAEERQSKSQGDDSNKPDRLEASKVEVAPDYDWEHAAKVQGLDEDARKQLKRDGLVIAGPAFRQSFSIYGDETIAPFVTSDSLLNGFHVLLEASLKRFELRRAARLREALELLWKGIDRRLTDAKVPRRQVESHIRHLARVIGPAMRLLGSSAPLGDPTLEADVTAMVRKISAAQTVELPEWMAPAEPSLLAIDFRRCRPLGFYADSPMLADYYRVVRWLQSVPLRASREVEVGAVALIAEMDLRGPRNLKRFVEQGEEVWGREGGASIGNYSLNWPGFLETIAKEGNATKAVAEARKQIIDQSKWRRTLVNDRMHAPGPAGSEDAALLMLAPSVLPDVYFLEAIATKRQTGRTWPQGLEVAAWLGSDFALNILRQRQGETLAEAIKARRDEHADGWGSTVPGLYYETLAALFAPPDAAAPAFMVSEAWQRKSVQTALAGWAQLRHAWELQTKLNVSAACAFRRPAGFVEPNPLFFHQMGQLQRGIVAKFQAGGVFTEDRADEIQFLRELLQLATSHGFGKIKITAHEADADDIDRIYDLVWIARQTDQSIDSDQLLHSKEPAPLESWHGVMEAVKARIGRLQRGEPVAPLDSLTSRRDPDQNLFGRWQELQFLTSQLQAMVQKQLRGVDWNEAEANLLKNYRETLGEVMGYFAIASSMPKDDAPRWTTVFHDPVADRNLAVAIGRPRALYVLYPWSGQQILCRGAVMTYYEYPSEKRLTDLEWKDLLDSPTAPVQPEWLKPIAAPANPTVR